MNDTNTLGLLIKNPRDQRGFDWLKTKATDTEILDAVEQLAGARQPYVSNVAKVLGLTIPDDATYLVGKSAQTLVDSLREKHGLPPRRAKLVRR